MFKNSEQNEILKQILHSVRQAATDSQETRELLHCISKTLRAQTDILKQIAADLAPTLTASIHVRFSGVSMANNALVLNVGQSATASIVPLLADGVTSSGGVVSGVSYTFSDPSATVVLNADGLTATCTGVAASTGDVAGSASCTVTDTDGAVSTWTQAFTIATNAVAPPQQLTQSVAVQFSTPTP